MERRERPPARRHLARALPISLAIAGPITKVNDDSSFARHLFPAVSVRSDGSAALSWYDRRVGGASSTNTGYFGEIPSTLTGSAPYFPSPPGQRRSGRPAAHGC